VSWCLMLRGIRVMTVRPSAEFTAMARDDVALSTGLSLTTQWRRISTTDR